MNCPRCASPDLLEPVRLFADGDKYGEVWADLCEPKPADAGFLWLPDVVTSNFTATICGACGHTEFTATNPRGLLEAQKKGYRTR
jgi:hypothetical protein